MGPRSVPAPAEHAQVRLCLIRSSTVRRDHEARERKPSVHCSTSSDDRAMATGNSATAILLSRRHLVMCYR